MGSIAQTEVQHMKLDGGLPEGGRDLIRQLRVEELQKELPTDHRPFADKYFLRTAEILKKKKLNPVVRAQVFIRKGPGILDGVDEAIAVIAKYAPNFIKNGGKVFALKDGEHYVSTETLMVLEGKLQDFVELETMYLGVLSAAVTRRNERSQQDINYQEVEARMREIVSLVEGRPVSYFGARHWTYKEDAAISKAAFLGGASSASTDCGAATFGSEGIGTIPHVLENAFAARYGKNQAVVEATKAFDRIIPEDVPRIALIDYNNQEIDDSISTAHALQGRLYGVRVDTPGENVAQGGIDSILSNEGRQWQKSWAKRGVTVPNENSEQSRYWYGRGVTVSGVYALRKALDKEGFEDVRIILTSGFGNPDKVRAFVDAEKLLGVKLFDALGVGGIFPSRAATMDVVGVQNTDGSFSDLAKTGRGYKKNPRLSEVHLRGAKNA